MNVQIEVNIKIEKANVYLVIVDKDHVHDNSDELIAEMMIEEEIVKEIEWEKGKEVVDTEGGVVVDRNLQ